MLEDNTENQDGMDIIPKKTKDKTPSAVAKAVAAVKEMPTSAKPVEIDVNASNIYQNRKVVIKAKRKETWSGFTRFPKCKDTITASKGRGGFHTGLSKAAQAQLEADLFLEKDMLSPYSKYWVEYAIHIYDKELELDLMNPKDVLDFHICMQSKRVANSINEMEDWPNAEYVVYDAEEDAKKDNQEVRERRAAFGKFSKMSVAEMKDVLKLRGDKAQNMSHTMIENAVDKLIQEDPQAFNAIVNLSGFKTRVLIEDLLAINAIRKNGSHYLVGYEPIGHDIESTVLHLEDPRNQNLLISLKNKLEAYA